MKETICDTSSCFLCRSCIPEWSELTALKKKTILFKRGESLFKEGAPVTGIYFTLDGAVKVHKHWGEQKELIIRFVGGGDIVGLRGLGGSSVFPVSATALEPTRACYVANEHVHASLIANPAFSYNLMQFYAAELTKAEHRMSELAHSEVKGRMARGILELQQTFGVTDDGFIALTISRQDIAAYAGTTYETVFKVLTEWIAASLIASEGKRLKILDARTLGTFQSAH